MVILQNKALSCINKVLIIIIIIIAIGMGIVYRDVLADDIERSGYIMLFTTPGTQPKLSNRASLWKLIIVTAEESELGIAI